MAKVIFIGIAAEVKYSHQIVSSNYLYINVKYAVPWHYN